MSRRRSRHASAAIAKVSTRTPGPGCCPHFTGISDPYQAPDDAALTIDTEQVGGRRVRPILAWLRRRDIWLKRDEP